MSHLDARSLGSLQATVGVPGYDRDQLAPAIVHFGVGAFHRAHQAMYLDRLAELGEQGWGVCGVGVLPGDARLRDVLESQDHLYTLVTKDPDGSTAVRVVGSLVTHLHAPDDPAAVVARLADPATRIASLTITEGGYAIDDATGEFDPRDEGTLADLADPSAPPRSVFGLLSAGLQARRDAGRVPFTVMSCDNLPGNGEVARAALLAFVERSDPALAAWIAAEVAFPSSMVDRITPATTDEVRAEVAGFGITDAWPIRAESFAQWVLEDHFTAGRPPLEQVGVQVVADVEPYELMKLRLLNASHQAMSHLGVLAGLTWVHEVGQDETFVSFLLDYMHREAMPTLPEVPGTDLEAYCRELVARFGNPAVADTLARLATDSSDRIPKFLLPVLRHQLATGGETARSVLVLAAWSRYLQGRTDAGVEIVPDDARLVELREHLDAEAERPGAFLGCRPVFGDLGEHPGLVADFVRARQRLADDGARAALAALADRAGS